MTTDLQRLHQDEFLADLRSGRFRQVFGQIRRNGDTRCALGVAYEQVAERPLHWNSRTAKRQVSDALGVSTQLASKVMTLNDSNLMPFPKIADWFKAQRDAYHGDLSHWPYL